MLAVTSDLKRHRMAFCDYLVSSASAKGSKNLTFSIDMSNVSQMRIEGGLVDTTNVEMCGERKWSGVELPGTTFDAVLEYLKSRNAPLW